MVDRDKNRILFTSLNDIKVGRHYLLVADVMK